MFLTWYCKSAINFLFWKFPRATFSQMPWLSLPLYHIQLMASLSLFKLSRNLVDAATLIPNLTIFSDFCIGFILSSHLLFKIPSQLQELLSSHRCLTNFFVLEVFELLQFNDCSALAEGFCRVKLHGSLHHKGLMQKKVWNKYLEEINAGQAMDVDGEELNGFPVSISSALR